MPVTHSRSNSASRHVPVPPGRDLHGIVRRCLWLALALFVILIPWAWLKVLGLCAIIILSRSVTYLGRPAAAALLGTLFAMAYLFSPYWLIPVDARHHALGPVLGSTAAAITSATLLLIIGAVWAWFSSQAVPDLFGKASSLPLRRLVVPALLALAILVINLAPLYYGVPVQGDEDWHMWRLRNLHMGLAPIFSDANMAITLLCALAAAAFLMFFKRPAIHLRVLIVGAALLAVALWRGFLNGEGMTYLMIRYPFVSTWLHQLGPVWNTSLFDEGAYRIVPLVSVFAIGFFVLSALRAEGASRVPAFLAALAVATIPNLYYHATALYLELPAVALVTFALYHVERLLRDDAAQVRTCPGWYAILAAAFIKETLLPIIATLILLRIVVRAYIMGRERSLRPIPILRELGIALCIATPVGIYLFIRTFFGDVRAYSPQFANLTNLSLYLTAVRAVWSQFGILLILSVMGFALALRQKRWLFAFSLLALFLADFVFHLMDNARFVGMARFDLLLFAPLMVLGLEMLKWLASSREVLLTAAAVIWLAVNIPMSPVAITGERKPYWMSPDTMSCDFYFPKQQAVTWLKENRPGRPFLVGGAYVDTKLRWYLIKLDHRVQYGVVDADLGASPMENLRKAVSAASANGIRDVLYFRMTPGTELTAEERNVLGYAPVQIFANHYLAIVLYEPSTTR